MYMARTLGSHDANQVAHKGRRVLIGWISVANIGGGIDPFSSQSLPRDLSLSSDYELLQQFVPELQALRKPATYLSVPFENATQANSVLAASSPRTRQLEVVASFTFNVSSAPEDVFGVEVLASSSTPQSTKLFVDCNRQMVGWKNCKVGVDTTKQRGWSKPGPLLPTLSVDQAGLATVTVHAIVDGPIVEAIFNNGTAITLRAQPALETDTAVRIFGPAPHGRLEVWELMSSKSESVTKSEEVEIVL